MEKKYNKVVIIYFLSADEKELKSGILSADKSVDKSADCRPTVGRVNVIAVLLDVIFLRNDKYYCYMKLVAFFKGYNVDKFWGIFEIIIFVWLC